MEIIAPFKESLSLFCHNPLSCRMTIRTHCSSLNFRILDGFVLSFRPIGSSNLSVRGQMTTRTCDSKRFFTLRACFWSFDLGLVQIGEVKGLRVVTDVAGFAPHLYVASMHGPGIGSCERMCRTRSEDSPFERKQFLLCRFVGYRLVH